MCLILHFRLLINNIGSFDGTKWNLSPQELVNLKVITPQDYNGKFNITIIGLEYEPQNGDVATANKTIDIIVLPTNDQPVVTIPPQLLVYEEVSSRIDNPFSIRIDDVDLKYGGQLTFMHVYLSPSLLFLYMYNIMFDYHEDIWAVAGARFSYPPMQFQT